MPLFSAALPSSLGLQAEEYRRVLLLQGGAALAAHTPQPLVSLRTGDAAHGDVAARAKQTHTRKGHGTNHHHHHALASCSPRVHVRVHAPPWQPIAPPAVRRALPPYVCRSCSPQAWEEMQQAAGGGLEGLPIGYQASSASAAGGPAGPAGSASPASRFAAAAAALSAMQRLPLPAGLAGKPLAVAAPEPVLLLEAAEGGGALETGAAGFVGDRSGVMDDCALLLAPSTPRPAASQGAQGRRMLLGAMLRNGGEETGCFGSSQLLDSAALSSADVPPPPLAAEAPDSGPVPQAAHTSSAAPYSLFELD